MIIFKFLWGINALASLVPLYFFVIGLADGSVNSRNMGLWALILIVFIGVLLGSIFLKNHQNTGFAIALLLIIALPALFYLIYLLIAMFGNQRWN